MGSQMEQAADTPLAHDGEMSTAANFNTDPRDASDTGGGDGEPKEVPAEEPEETPEAAETEEPAPYEPNLKFKVLDEEHEIDDFMKDVITDEEREQKVRELYQKAYGIDHIKSKYQDTREELKTVKTNYDHFMAEVADLRDDYNSGDFDSFFKKLAIPREKILEWVYNEAKYQELPPEQRQAMDAKRQAEQQARTLEKQNQQLQTYYMEQVTQAKANALNVALQQPEIKQAMEQFDARVGKPGAFRDEVINRGEMAWNLQNKDIPPEQAIQEVLQLAGMSPGSTQQPLQSNGAGSMGMRQSPQPTQQATHKRPPTIPNLEGKTGSPMRNQPKSLDDLRKIYADMRK